MKIQNKRVASKGLLKQLQAVSSKATKARKKRGDKNSPHGYETMWWSYMRDFWPDIPEVSWSLKTQAVSKHLSQRFRQGFDHKEFFFIVVRHWDDIMAQRFSWMKHITIPKQPEITFVYTHIDKFAEMFQDYTDTGIIRRVESSMPVDDGELDQLKKMNRRLVAQLEDTTKNLRKHKHKLRLSRKKKHSKIDRDIAKLRMD